MRSVQETLTLSVQKKVLIEAVFHTGIRLYKSFHHGIHTLSASCVCVRICASVCWEGGVHRSYSSLTD